MLSSMFSLVYWPQILIVKDKDNATVCVLKAPLSELDRCSRNGKWGLLGAQNQKEEYGNECFSQK